LVDHGNYDIYMTAMRLHDVWFEWVGESKVLFQLKSVSYESMYKKNVHNCCSRDLEDTPDNDPYNLPARTFLDAPTRPYEFLWYDGD
jgi:hypothetical protein